MKNKMLDLSSKYYQSIPLIGNIDSYKPILTPSHLKQEIDRYRSINYLVNSSLLLLGAIKNSPTIHPIDYVYQSLRTTITNVSIENNQEIKIICKYISKSLRSRNIHITNIYQLNSNERKTLFNPNILGNRVLLFHGTKERNLLGIISQGLLISPASSSLTGSSYGKGIYFTDSFEKAMDYSEVSGDIFLFVMLH